jgi:glycosyltransferase involved in cell wall biosynthesis
MRARIVVESRYARTPDGAVWTPTAFHYRFFARYLSGFSAVEVVARIEEVAQVPANWSRVDGEGVTTLRINPYQGLVQFLRQRSQVRQQLQPIITQPTALILRIPSPLISCIHGDLLRRRLPYAVEVIGDPWGVFAPGVVSHPLRPLLRRYLTSQQRQQCRQAMAAAYVTEKFLQDHYPCPGRMFACSDVDLSEKAFVATARSRQPVQGPRHLLMLGSLEQLYKGPDVLLHAMALCRQRNLPLKATIAGDGRFRPAMQRLAGDLGLADAVTFAGHIPAGDAVRTLIDAADVFVMPSRTEGLPKALLEAMARALPCIASRVGGIPELLTPDALVEAGSAAALATALESRLTDAEWLLRQSQRNLEHARLYQEAHLAKQRSAFFAHVREGTAQILGARLWQPGGR